MFVDFRASVSRKFVQVIDKSAIFFKHFVTDERRSVRLGARAETVLYTA